MYFVLGMLSIVGAIILATIVWGVVKINSLLKEVKNNDEEFNNLNRIIWENHNNTREDLDHRFKDMYDEIKHTHSYIDSRIDKVTGILGAKQVIKG